jgi:uncharacterized protein (DUF362 family)
LFKKISRKNFLKICFAGLAGLILGSRSLKDPVEASASTQSPAIFNGRRKKNIKGDYDLVVTKGDDPYALTVKAVDGLGGISRFVKKNDVVLIKPNIGWDRSPEQAANTNPQVVAALIDLSFKAGAKRVNVFDIPCNDAKRTYDNSGIQQIAKEKGANIYYADEWNTVPMKLAYDSPMNGWPILKDAIGCDTFINVPILKHHSLAGLTISMKNLMGICGGDRGRIHNGIGVKLVDLTDFINPELTIVDAYRVLLRHGPVGGDLNDVKRLDTIIAGTDPVLADAYAATLMDMDPMSLSYIKEAAARGLGSADIGKAKILIV